MNLKFYFVFLFTAWMLPVYGQEPTNAIDWFLNTENNTKRINSVIADHKNSKSLSLDITKSELKPRDLNSIGVIPAKITGIDPSLWKDVNETTLFNELNSLPELQFHSAQTFLKRIFISETNPPISSPKNKLSGKLYLITKLDKLIKIGALEEAETIIRQVDTIDSALFKRLVKISLLTGRVIHMCKQLRQNSNLSRDLAIRVICLSKLNDWDAAALILSSAASLNLVSKKREMLLLNYLDPDLEATKNHSHEEIRFDEIDFYLKNEVKEFRPRPTDEVKYLYATLINSSDPVNLILAAEELMIKKSITVSTLFDTYRTNNISGTKSFWSRMVAVKNLDRTLEKNNKQAVSIAVSRAIEEMFQRNLLFALASEYASKLADFDIQRNRKEFNDSLAIIFALNGEIPRKWVDYQSQNKYISMAYKILNDETLSQTSITEVIRLVDPSFYPSENYTKPKNNSFSNNKEVTKNKGLLVLGALRKSSKGVNTRSDDLHYALLSFLDVNEPELVKAILIEYLIHYTRTRV